MTNNAKANEKAKTSGFLPLLILESLRPKQWTKNFFIFAGILFSQNILHPALLVKTLEAFTIFCLLSGAVYILNDLVDIEQDRNHPRKCKRPLASGRLKVVHAGVAWVILTLAALGASFVLDRTFFIVALAYFLLQIAYSSFLKHIVIIDVFVLAAGFVLRVAAGAVLIHVPISSWLLICTILLSLFLGFVKRRHELESLESGAQNHRRVLEEYSSYFLDQMIAVVTTSTVICYALYTMSAETVKKFGTQNLIFTVPFVLYGIFRYLYLVHQKGQGGSPENILVSDKPLMIDVLLWAVTAGIIIYVR